MQKLDKIKRRLEHHPVSADVFVIAIAQNSADQLDIFQSSLLEQRYYQKLPIHVVGLCATYSEALLIVERMAQECLDRRGDCAIREYLLC